MAQWLRVCLPMQGARVRALVWEDLTCRGAAGPVSHNYWACASGACAPQQERPRWWEARALRWGVDPACCSWGEPSHRNEDPTQPQKNKLKKKKCKPLKKKKTLERNQPKWVKLAAFIHLLQNFTVIVLVSRINFYIFRKSQRLFLFHIWDTFSFWS